MTKAARVVDSFVVEVQENHPDGFSFYDCFPAETVALFIECPDEVEAGWYYDGQTWAPPASDEIEAYELCYGPGTEYRAYIQRHKDIGIAFVGRPMADLKPPSPQGEHK